MTDRTHGGVRRWRKLLFVTTLAAGCVPSAAVRQDPAPPHALSQPAVRMPVAANDFTVPVLPAANPELPDGPLSLEALLAFAADRHPDMGAARARAGVARGRLVQASLYPNPTLTWE